MTRVLTGLVATDRVYVEVGVRLELVEAPCCWRCGVALAGLGKREREILRKGDGWVIGCSSCRTAVDRAELAALEAEGIRVVHEWQAPADLRVPDVDPRDDARGDAS